MSEAYDLLFLSILFGDLAGASIFFIMLSFIVAFMNLQDTPDKKSKLSKVLFYGGLFFTFFFFTVAMVGFSLAESFKIKAGAKAVYILQVDEAQPEEVKKFLSIINEKLE